MKKTTLAAKDSDLLEQLIIRYGKVVTSSQIQAVAENMWDYQQTHNRIQQLVENGWLIRVKRGLYLIADLSSRGFISVSPYVIANLLVKESYVSFEAALAYRGMFDQFTGQITSVSLKQYIAKNLESVQYRFLKTQEKMFSGWEEVQIDNLPAKIALAEKALVDLVHFRTGIYAVDLVIEKLQDYQKDLDNRRLFQYIRLASQKTVKIFGFVFDLLGMTADPLQSLISKNRSTHWISRGDKTFNAKWRLYYDDYLEKYRTQEGD